jgi:hypothetical protein
MISLSLRERAGVRGNGTCDRLVADGLVKLVTRIELIVKI